MVFYDLLTGSMTQTSWMDDFSQDRQTLYDSISQDNNTHVLSTESAKTINARENYLFHLGHRIIDYKNVDEQLGIVIVSIDEQLLKDVCRSSEKDSNGFNFIVDSQGKLVSYQNNTLVGERIIEWNPDVMERQAAYGAFITENSVFSGEYSSVIVVHDDKLNWDVVNVTNQNEVVSRLKNQQKITLLALDCRWER